MHADSLCISDDISRLWDGYSRGDVTARDRLFALHYAEFKGVARRVLNGSSDRFQIQPTDLAHEAAIRLLGLDRIRLRDHTHFLALSARIMRQALIDEVRRHNARKRNRQGCVTLWFEAELPADSQFDLEAFDDLLTRLAEIDADRAQVVELRFFAGLTLEEVAAFLDISESTVQRRWRGARAWLLNELNRKDD